MAITARLEGWSFICTLRTQLSPLIVLASYRKQHSLRKASRQIVTGTTPTCGWFSGVCPSDRVDPFGSKHLQLTRMLQCRYPLQAALPNSELHCRHPLQAPVVFWTCIRLTPRIFLAEIQCKKRVKSPKKRSYRDIYLYSQSTP